MRCESTGGESPLGFHEPGSNCPNHAPSTLADAIAYIGSGLCADAASLEAGEDFDRLEKEWVLLRHWAEENALIRPATFPPPAHAGGREHLVRFDADLQRWWKYSKPHSAGYTVEWSEAGEPYMLPAHPLQYLHRLQWQNEIFGDSICLEGLWKSSDGWHILTTQGHVSGDRCSITELQQGFEELGFIKLPWTGIGYEQSIAFRKDGFDIWDVHPANVIMTPSGLPLPFDVVVTRVPDLTADV